jgi:transcriptional regulator with XRE-family HTH domain
MGSGISEKFGVHLRAMRRSRGLTQDALAERSELSVDSIRRIERGAFSPSLDTLAKLADGLETTLPGLFGYFDRGRRDEVLELSDYLSRRNARELRQAIRVVRAMFEGQGTGPTKASP